MTVAVLFAGIERMPWTYWLGVGVSFLSGLFVAVLLIEYVRRVAPLEEELEQHQAHRTPTAT